MGQLPICGGKNRMISQLLEKAAPIGMLSGMVRHPRNNSIHPKGEYLPQLSGSLSFSISIGDVL